MAYRVGKAGVSATRLWTALVAGLLAVAVALPAMAQEQPRRGLFQFLFGSGPRRIEREFPPAPPVRKKPRAARPSAPAEPVIAAVEKLPDAKVVLVVGDFQAKGLAEALTDVYAESAGVQVVGRSNGSSGFVRDDHYDWLGQIGPIIEETKPAAVVVMIGANDRQEMRVGDAREQKRSDAWTVAYEARVAAFAKSVRDRGIALVWVGMVPFKAASVSSDMLAFNGIYRAGAEQAGGVFVDVWDGFVDENGAYVSTGPDINGQPVRLRSGDTGASLTSAGKRKVAFYLEKPLQRILGGGPRPDIASAGGPAVPGMASQPSGPVDRTVPISLTDPELDGGGELLGANIGPAAGDARLPAASTVGKASPTPGRADYFSASPAAAPEPADSKTTAAIPRQ